MSESRASRFNRDWLQIRDDRKIRGFDQRPDDRKIRDFPGAYDLDWATEFNTEDSFWDSWGLQAGRWGQSAGENQEYTEGYENVTVDDDNSRLIIHVRKETPPDEAAAPNDYTSARVASYGKQEVSPPVRIVGRIKVPYTKGILPAFWTVGLEPGHEFDWPRQGEIDIMEIHGSGQPEHKRMWIGNLHGPSEANNTVDVKFDDLNYDTRVDLSADFHEYGIDWYTDRIIWHVDGKQVGIKTKADYENAGGDWTPFSGAWPHYLILNVAVGNPWQGDPDGSSVFPQQMIVDWVKVWDIAD